MDRRALGAVVVVLVVVGAVLTPNLAGRRIAGSAARVPIVAPPQVGECLLAPVLHGRSALVYVGVTVRAVPVGVCANGNYGEVVSVTADVSSFPTRIFKGRMPYPDPTACESPARAYLGWDPGASVGPADPQPAETVGPLAAWHPTVTESLGLLGPDLPQFLAGQRWIGCVILPRQQPYTGSIRADAAVPSAADVYGSCRAAGGAVMWRPVPCAEPHAAEVFGWIAMHDRTAESARASCVQLIRAATGMPDPTGGGRLRVEMDTAGDFADRQDAALAMGRGLCAVTVAGDGELVGSLTGLGDAPLPLR